MALSKEAEAVFQEILKVAKHPTTCRCRNPHCIQLRRSTRAWNKKMQSLIDEIRDSERITAEDLAVTINARG